MKFSISAAIPRLNGVFTGAHCFSRLVMFAALASTLGATPARAAFLYVSGNNAGPTGPIQQWAVGLPAAPFPAAPDVQFVPDAAFVPGANGRALAADQFFLYYSELSSGFGPSDGIHVISVSDPMKHDVRVFANPNPGWGIQDLDVFDLFGDPYSVNASLYALTGYPSGAPTVFRLSRFDGHVIGLPVVLQAPAAPDSDGFTVLPNGNFLVNTGDASPTYQEFDSITGAAVGQGFTVPCGQATGVDAGPTTLVIQCDFNSFLITDFSGNVLDKVLVTGNHIEDIEGIFGPPLPEPASLGLLGLGLAALGLVRRRAGRLQAAVEIEMMRDPQDQPRGRSRARGEVEDGK
ncbi:PEP-CTERM sorting domain-containing protein [Accumulibacter sp.]|uniref:PEP-CTERM sorting domain-containing protein n=1 Tax=Accumulibacter sp. TaxID=2053492 RepID=UPI002602612F|nr:PEP-CTERM sorting domain-containing protein [Accumulibacter sp.]